MDKNNLLTQDEMLAKLREMARGTAQYVLAGELGINAPYLSDILAGKRPVPEGVAARLGYRREYCYFPLEKQPA